jgi:hypothetical protein
MTPTSSLFQFFTHNIHHVIYCYYRAASKAAFTYIMDNALQYPNVTSALAAEGIEDTFGLFTLTDTIVENLTYPDPDPNVKTIHHINKGDMGLLKSFIHYIYYCDESGNPIGDK